MSESKATSVIGLSTLRARHEAVSDKGSVAPDNKRAKYLSKYLSGGDVEKQRKKKKKKKISQMHATVQVLDEDVGWPAEPQRTYEFAHEDKKAVQDDDDDDDGPVVENAAEVQHELRLMDSRRQFQSQWEREGSPSRQQKVPANASLQETRRKLDALAAETDIKGPSGPSGRDADVPRLAGGDVDNTRRGIPERDADVPRRGASDRDVDVSRRSRGDVDVPRRRAAVRDADSPRRGASDRDADVSRRSRGDVDVARGGVSDSDAGVPATTAIKRGKEVGGPVGSTAPHDRSSEIIYRVAGRAVSKEEFQEAQDAKKPKRQKRYLEEDVPWKEGLVQRRARENAQREQEEEGRKKFQREFDDKADAAMQEDIRMEDPMADYFAAKRMDALSAAYEEAPSAIHEGELGGSSGFSVPQRVPEHSWIRRRVQPLPNRYNIKPGRHWDGVHRSNGFEQKFVFQYQHKKAERARDEYVLAEDM